MRYKKKLVLDPQESLYPQGIIVDAFQWTGDENQTEDPEWFVKIMREGKVNFRNRGTSSVLMEIQTFSETVRAFRGDFIVKEIDGDIRPYKQDVFEETYEKIND